MKLEDIRQAHIDNGHHEQATVISGRLKARFPALAVSGKEDAESGRYVAVYVTLVPDILRMMIMLKDGDANHHAYQLRGMTETVADGARFEEFMRREHPATKILNSESNRPYARAPSWENLFVSNEDHETIARNVLVGLSFIAKLQWAGHER